MRTLRPVSSSGLRDRRLSFFISGLAAVAASGHVLIFLFSVLAGVRALAVFNVGSIALYAGLFFLNRIGKYSVVLTAALAEVLVHAVVATLLIGWETHFHLYILPLIPLIYYVDQWPIRVRGAASVTVLITYVGLALVADHLDNVPIYDVEHRLVSIGRYGNMSIAAAVLIALSVFYQSAVTRAERYMEKYSDTLQRLSLSDPLTGILNRRGTDAQLTDTLSTSCRGGGSVAVAILDLDHFKSINDRFGHEVGDTVLKSVVSAVSKAVRDSDFFGRWGGEEFLVILSNADEDGARLATRRIREAINELTVPAPSGERIPVTATIGVAIYDPGRDPASLDKAKKALLQRADEALYAGKSAGRDRIVFGSSTA